ncbi:MAG TPA: NHL repeat-containing protein [Solirubrobacterales bacterium]|nr:NHL repeat-containing protein [Solirubrobacterales bacterium]
MMAVGSASAAPPEYVESFGPDGTSATGFGHAASIAVDQENGWVYVLDYGEDTVSRFDLDGNPVSFSGSAAYLSGNQITGLSLPDQTERNQVAVDSISHRLYVTNNANAIRAFEPSGEPAEFSEGPNAGTSELTGFNALRGVAVDPTGHIYASQNDQLASGEAIRVFAPSGAEVAQAAVGGIPRNLAVDSHGTVYVAGDSDVQKLTPTEFPVTTDTEYSEPVTFYSSPVFTVAVDPATNDVYVAGRGGDPRISQFSEAGKLLSTFAAEGEEGAVEQSEGIGIEGQSTRVFVSNFPGVGLSQVEVFQPVVGAPTIERVFASEVTADAARLIANINPNTRDTEYYFEYGLDDCSLGTVTCTKVPVAGASIGNGHRVITVSQNIDGLESHDIYHYRVVAINELGETASPDQTFITQEFGRGIPLADSRVWEMVSPSNKFGGVLMNPPGGPIQAAEDGDGMVYQTLGSILFDAEGNRSIERSTVLASRTGGNWTSRDLTPPHLKPTPPVGLGSEYDAFSRDLSAAAVEPRDDNPLSPFATSKTPYLRLNAEPHTFVPLVTSKEGHANVEAGTEFGGPGKEITVSGVTSELDHIVVRSEAPLVPGAEGSSLYAWSADSLDVVSALPSTEGGSVVKAILGSDKGSTRNAVSEDGTRAFWGQGSYDSAGINTTSLYMRNLSSERTVRLDVPQEGATGAGEPTPAFQGASADGTNVFFSDSRDLTDDASPDGRDLYRCELVGPDPEECTLTNITAPRSIPGESAGFLGVVSALSDDGSRVYFVAEGVLSADANEEGDTAQARVPNLYLWEEGNGVRYIATLSQQDRTSWGVRGTSISFSFWLSSAVSPSGQYFTFMSELSLTGYDNRDATTGEPTQEVFVYDAATGSLRCASCNPTGGAPKALKIPLEARFPMVDPQFLLRDRLIAAALPQARAFGNQEYSTYRPRSVLDNGRVFFNAADSLVSGDSNGTWDAYQYEPIGTGSCSVSSGGATTARIENACISLISSGTSDTEAAFLDASANGDDAFFITPSRLSALDTDSVYDIYDARVNGTAATIDPITECAGEACQPLVAPPNDPTPASEAFRGPGNLKQCPKGKRKVKRHGKVRCVPKSKKKKSAKKAGQSRRADR